MATDIAKMLAAKQAAIAAGAIKASSSAVANAEAHQRALEGQKLGGVATGMQGSQESAGTMVSPTLPKGTIQLNEEKAKNCMAVYEDKHLKKYFRPGTGEAVKSEYGYFYAKDHVDVELLQYYDMIGKVKKVAE